MNKIIGFESGSVWQALYHAWHNVRCLVTGNIVEFASLPAMLVFYQALAFGAVMLFLAVWGLWATGHGQETMPQQMVEAVPQRERISRQQVDLVPQQEGIAPQQGRSPQALLQPHGRTSLWVPLREMLFHSYNIWGLTLAMIFLYYVDRNGAWRMFTSHFL